MNSASGQVDSTKRDWLISPLEGEMGGSPEGGAKDRRASAKSSLFAKPHLDDMGRSGDYAVPAGNAPPVKPLFRKNSLDEMTVRRTEKPIEGKVPAKPQPISPLAGEMAGRPEGGAKERGMSDDAKPINRERAGIGSYEDPADARRQKRRPGKTGRPGR